MKRILGLTALLLTVFVSSCGDESKLKRIGDPLVKNITSAKTIQVNAKMTDWSEVYSAEILLDTLFLVQLSDKEFISDATKILVHEDVIYVFDELRQGIFSFDMNGEFLGAIDRTGRGPGEFVKISDFDIDREKGEILVLDQFNRKMLHFDLKCQFIRDVRYQTHARFFGVLKSNYLIYNDFNSRWGDVNFNLFRTNEQGDVYGHAFEYDPIYSETSREKHSYITNSSEGKLDYIGHYDNEWYEITADTISLKYILDFGKYNIEPGIVHNSFDALDDYAHTISYFFESSNYVTFAYLFQKNLYLRYYDKSNEFLIPDWVGLPHVVYFNFNFPVKAVYQDYFINAIDSEALHGFLQDYPENYDFESSLKDKSLTTVMSQYAKVGKEDNMILSFYKLKSSKK